MPEYVAARRRVESRSLGRLAGALVGWTPPAWRRRPWPVPLGQMLATARGGRS